MMRCRSCEKQLSAWLDGELAPGRAAEVEAHVAACPACAARAARLREVSALVDGLPSPVPSPEFAAGFRRKLAQARQVEREAAERPRRWFFRLPALATAATAACALVLGLTLLRRDPALERPPEAELAQNIELLRDYEVVSNLDALEDFEAIASLDALEGRR
jgi:anti-sigma factor RsiW